MKTALFALLLAQAILLARMLFEREWVIAGYLLLAQYSTLTYQPFADGWWTSHWIWLEPILVLARTAVTIRILGTMHRKATLIGLSVAVAACALYGLGAHEDTLIRTLEAYRTYWIMGIYVTLAVAAIAHGLKTGDMHIRTVWWALILLSYLIPALMDWWLDRVAGPYNHDRMEWTSIALIAISTRVLICTGWALAPGKNLENHNDQNDNRELAHMTRDGQFQI